MKDRLVILSDPCPNCGGKAMWDISGFVNTARREGAEAVITKLFGTRCKDFDEDCPTCEAWRALDEVFEPRRAG